jgi:hypothetical protein
MANHQAEKPGKARTIYLYDEDVEQLKRLGGGNISRGIRRAIELAVESQSDEGERAGTRQ